jgi:uncharacterized membrane protein YeaQ/YmgE (transglycosylase-associated protein family)
MGRLAGIWLTVVALLFAPATSADGFPPAQVSRCTPSVSEVATAVEKQARRTATRSVALVRLTSRTLKVSLGSDSGPQVRTFAIQTPPLKSTQKLFVEPEGDLERSDAATFPADQINVAHHVTPLGHIVIEVCLDPQIPRGVAPGRYLGAIGVGGPGIETTAFPLEVTVQGAESEAIIWIVLGTVIGLVAKMLIDIAKAPNTAVSWATVWGYVRQGVFLVAIVTAIVGAIVNFLALYEPDPTWGSSFDEIKIFVAGVVLQTTGTTLTDLVKKYEP